MLSGLYDIEFEMIISILQPIFISIIILQYFYYSKDYYGLLFVIKFTVLFLIITSITSLIGLQQYPMAARELGGKLHIEGNYALATFYKSIGIISYDFIYGMVFSFPIFIAMLKMKDIDKKYRITILIVITFGFLVIIYSQYTIPLLFTITAGLLAFWTPEKSKRVIIFIGIVIGILLLFSHTFIDIFFYASKLVPIEMTQEKMLSFGNSLKSGIGVDEQVDFRVRRVPNQLENFFDSPIFGGNETTGHVYWFDVLSMFGIIGLFPWFLLIRDQIKRNLRHINNTDKVYYLISMLFFVLLGCIRSIGSDRLMMFVFFIIPSLALIKKYLSNKSLFTKPIKRKTN